MCVLYNIYIYIPLVIYLHTTDIILHLTFEHESQSTKSFELLRTLYFMYINYIL